MLQIVVFSKSYCPHCKATKSTLKEYINPENSDSFNVKIVELDLLDGEDGRLIQKELFEQVGQTTVPNIFIHGEHIGGNSDLQRLASIGHLEIIINGAGEDL